MRRYLYTALSFIRPIQVVTSSFLLRPTWLTQQAACTRAVTERLLLFALFDSQP
jgi:hypothetical protein